MCPSHHSKPPTWSSYIYPHTHTHTHNNLALSHEHTPSHLVYDGKTNTKWCQGNVYTHTVQVIVLTEVQRHGQNFKNTACKCPHRRQVHTWERTSEGWGHTCYEFKSFLVITLRGTEIFDKKEETCSLASRFDTVWRDGECFTWRGTEQQLVVCVSFWGSLQQEMQRNPDNRREANT